MPCVCELTSSLGPVACDILTSFVRPILRDGSVSLLCKSNAATVHISLSLTHPLPTLHSSVDRLQSPAKCKRGAQQVKLKVKFSFSSFLQNPVNRTEQNRTKPAARQEASRQLLLDIHNSGLQWARTRIGRDRGVQLLYPKLQIYTDKL